MPYVSSTVVHSPALIAAAARCMENAHAPYSRVDAKIGLIPSSCPMFSSIPAFSADRGGLQVTSPSIWDLSMPASSSAATAARTAIWLPL